MHSLAVMMTIVNLLKMKGRAVFECGCYMEFSEEQDGILIKRCEKHINEE